MDFANLLLGRSAPDHNIDELSTFKVSLVPGFRSFSSHLASGDDVAIRVDRHGDNILSSLSEEFLFTRCRVLHDSETSCSECNLSTLCSVEVITSRVSVVSVHMFKC